MRKTSFFACLIGLFAVACGDGCDNSEYSGPNGPSDGTVFTAPDGSQCADATPCGNCDQDCRAHGNPFLPSPGDPVPGAGGASGGGSGDGSNGDGSGGGLTSGGDGPGIAGGAGGGGTGFDGDPCTLNSDCRGLCGGAGVCEGHGEGGFNGDSCLSANDCRGECGGDGICNGSGTDPGLGGGVGGGIGGSCGGGGTIGGSDPSSGGGTIDPSGGTDGSGGGTGGAGDPDGTGGGGVPGGGGGPDGTDGGGGGLPGGGTGGPGAGGSGGGPSTDPSVCQDLDIRLQHAIPTIALLIDQSGSMNQDFGNGMTRWDAEYHSLMDPAIGIVKDIEHAFRIGMSLYSGVGNMCPNLRDVRPELSNYDAIDRVFGTTDPLQETPTGESLLGTLRQFDVHPDQGRKIVLLSTDGEPDTCAEPNPQNGQPEAVAAAQAAYQQGIETFLLSVGDEVGVPHLEDMANAGVGFAVGGAKQAPFYTANNPEQLSQQMLSILGGARSCIFRVQGGIVDPGVIDQASITLDGVALELNHPDGWRYHQNVQTCQGGKQCVELTGQACEAVQDGQSHIIHGDFMCAYYDPDNPPIGGGGGSGGAGDGSGGTSSGSGGTGGGTDGTGSGSGGGAGDGTGGGGTSSGPDGSDGSGSGTGLGGSGTGGGDYPCVYDPGTGSGGGGGTGSGSGSGSGSGGTGSGGGSGGTGSGGGGGPGMSCIPSEGACEYDGDCCSGFCSGATSGICVIP